MVAIITIIIIPYSMKLCVYSYLYVELKYVHVKYTVCCENVSRSPPQLCGQPDERCVAEQAQLFCSQSHWLSFAVSAVAAGDDEPQSLYHSYILYLHYAEYIIAFNQSWRNRKAYLPRHFFSRSHALFFSSGLSISK